jgi:hypothetical protein
MICVWTIGGSVLLLALGFVGLIALIAKANSFGDSGSVD